MLKGIYIIKNNINNKIYIGSSNDIRGRFCRHRHLLKRNIHPNSHLQRSWNKYGEIAFTFDILEIVDNEDCLIGRESYYFDLFGIFSGDLGYNILGVARRHKGKRGSLDSDHRKNISKGLFKFYKNNGGSPKKGKKYKYKRTQTPETRKKISTILKNKYANGYINKNIGKKHSLETKLKIKHRYKELVASGEYKNNFLGKKHTKESREAMSASHKGKPLSQSHKNSISKAFSGKNHPLYGLHGKDNPKYIVLPLEIVDKICFMYQTENKTITDIINATKITREVIRRTLVERNISIKLRNQNN